MHQYFSSLSLEKELVYKRHLCRSLQLILVLSETRSRLSQRVDVLSSWREVSNAEDVKEDMPAGLRTRWSVRPARNQLEEYCRRCKGLHCKNRCSNCKMIVSVICVAEEHWRAQPSRMSYAV